MRRWQVPQAVALVLVFGEHEGALDAHELAGHRGPTYEVTDALQLEPGQRRLRLTVVDQETAKPTVARFSLTLDGENYTPEGLSPGGLRFVSIHAGKKQRFVALYARFLIDRLTNQIEYYRTRAKYEKPEDQERALGLFELAIEKLSGQVDQQPTTNNQQRTTRGTR